MEGIYHSKSQARELALQFLYQCECEKLFYFSEPHFRDFVTYHQVSPKVARAMRDMVAASFAEYNQMGDAIEVAAKNWRLERMAATDRCVLRIAATELTTKAAPVKVVINEAIELAKKYGTENSGAFVNGVLDRMAIDRGLLH